MRYLVLTAAIAASISMGACQTTATDTLFAGIAAEKIAPLVDVNADANAGINAGVNATMPGLGVSAPVMSPAMSLAANEIRASGANPVCGQFNMNSLAYAANPSKSFPGLGIIKTIASGVIAGAASGAVSSIGIESSFVENMVAGTVNQVVYNASKPVIDGVFPAAEETDKAAELASAAERVGCPDPTSWLKGLSLTDAKTLLTTLNAEFRAAKAAANVVNDVTQ